MNDYNESRLLHLAKHRRGFPGASVGKESACNVGDLGWIPGSGISPREGNGYTLQYSCLSDYTQTHT